MLNDPFKRLLINHDVLTVSQLNRCARSLLEDAFAGVCVVGEVSNLAKPASGHIYFTLKDQEAQIRCALFRQQALRVRDLVREGVAVKAYGKVSLYEGRGDYQLIVERIELAGEGALRLAFELLQKKLELEGLFAVTSKKVLPKHPKRIGLVTSSSGAVIKDMISVFKRRAPYVELVLIATAVQGKEATDQIIKALVLADKQNFDAIILARGGGSLEDLWCFNEEAVARAIFACVTPIISGVGHETDVTIADFVADVRAPTPSAAAELLAPHHEEVILQVIQLKQRMIRMIQSLLVTCSIQLTGVEQRLRQPTDVLSQQIQRIDDLALRLLRAIDQQRLTYNYKLEQASAQLMSNHPQYLLQQYNDAIQGIKRRMLYMMQERLKQWHVQLAGQIHALQIVSPLATLERGYSILLTEQNQVIQNANQVRRGQLLKAKLRYGELTVEVLSHGKT